MGPLLFVGIFLVFVGIAGLQWWLKQKRIEELKKMAVQLGLDYTAYDLEGMLMWPFVLFGKGEGRGIEHVMSGTWQGVDLREFDYWYYEETSNGKGGRSKTYYRFSCVLMWITADCPALTVSRENVFTRFADVVGFDDIQLELGEFNEAFQVRSSDRKFAYDFLDARMMQLLLATDGFNFEVVGKGLLVYARQMAPLTLTPLLGTAKAFHDGVPRVVYELYGPGGEHKPGQIT